MAEQMDKYEATARSQLHYQYELGYQRGRLQSTLPLDIQQKLRERGNIQMKQAIHQMAGTMTPAQIAEFTGKSIESVQTILNEEVPVLDDSDETIVLIEQALDKAAIQLLRQAPVQ